MLTNVWSHSIRSRRVSQFAKHALVGLIVSLVVVGAVLGAGIGMGAADADSDD